MDFISDAFAWRKSDWRRSTMSEHLQGCSRGAPPICTWRVAVILWSWEQSIGVTMDNAANLSARAINGLRSGAVYEDCKTARTLPARSIAQW